MKKLVMVLLLVGLPPALAQGTPDLLKQARELEKRASALLDQEKRAEAFDLLARAAKLRERVRLAAKKNAKTAVPRPNPNHPGPKKERVDKPRDLRPIQHHVEAAFQKMDRAMQAGDMAAFRKAAEQSRALLSRWATGLQAQEKKIIARTPQAVVKRVARLERQVKELAKLLDSLSR